MSLIIAKKENGAVCFGADTLTSRGNDSCFNKLAENDCKVTRMPKGILIGGAGDVRVIQRLTAHKDWFEDLDEDELCKPFLVLSIVPRLYLELKKNQLLRTDSAVARFDGAFLIAQKGDLYLLDEDFSVMEIPDFEAIGCGDSAAYAVHNGGSFESAREEMLAALRLASGMDPAIGAPFVFIDTEKQEYETVGE